MSENIAAVAGAIGARGGGLLRAMSVLQIVVRRRVLALATLIALAVPGGWPGAAATGAEPAPAHLADTGLYLPGTRRVHPDNLAFSPQYTLWSDGATKRRWLYLPPGTAIDASDTSAWAFPRGTKLWKEFSHDRAVETRLIERLADGSWRFLAYVWDVNSGVATLAPAAGTTLAVSGAPAGRYTIPSRDDCRACHEGTPVPVLGVSALQLSPSRDPRSPRAEPKLTDLVDLADRGLLRKLPHGLRELAPAVRASSPTARAALGYLHANCGHCHNDRGPLADIGLVLWQAPADTDAVANALRSSVGHATETRAFGLGTRIVAGEPRQSQLVARMRTLSPLTRMPPLATGLIDDEGVALVEEWIRQLQPQEANTQ